MHDYERKWAKDKAADFAKIYKEQTGTELSPEQAQNMLLGIGYRMVDASANKGPGMAGPRDDVVAVAYIKKRRRQQA